MANVTLPKNTYVDLYAATGIMVGRRIIATNLTPNDVRLFDDELEPTPTSDHIPLLFGRGSAENSSGDDGAWGLCVGGGAINVELA